MAHASEGSQQAINVFKAAQQLCTHALQQGLAAVSGFAKRVLAMQQAACLCRKPGLTTP
jgi:hypothetical protein